MLTKDQRDKIETTGIIPDHLLEEYLLGKLLVAPIKTIWDVGLEERAFQTRYDEYLANQKRAKDETNRQAKKANRIES